jgi:pilus assembly protein CpaF
MEGDIISLQDLALFDYSAGMDEDGKFRGQLKATGLRPRFVDHLAEQGISIPAEVFAPDGGRRK